VGADLAVERMKLYSKIKPVLTDAQRAKISELEQNFDGTADSLMARIGDD
jgi:Spy/CpxP family protein refolding chaperone